MKRLRSVDVLLLLVLSACSRGSSTSGSLPNTPAIGPQSTTQAERGTQSDALRSPQPLSVAASSDLLYVSNLGNNSITVYHHDAQGNTAPIATIMGSKTGIIGPGQLSEDSQGNLYVANGFVGFTNESPNASVLVFAHGANGNAAPIRKLAGAATMILGISGMTVDKVTNKLFVTSMRPYSYGTDPGAVLLRFPPNANGNTAPFASGYIGEQSIEMDSDSTGQNVIVQQSQALYVPYSGVTSTFTKQFANNSSLTARYSASILDASGVADDPTVKSYLVSGVSFQVCNGSQTGKGYSGIVRLAENTAGFAQPIGWVPCTATLNPAPISDITSATGCGQLALGYLRNIYAVCGSAIKVFTHDASGNVSPLRVLSGSATKLNQPFGIYEGT